MYVFPGSLYEADLLRKTLAGKLRSKGRAVGFRLNLVHPTEAVPVLWRHLVEIKEQERVDKAVEDWKKANRP